MKNKKTKKLIAMLMTAALAVSAFTGCGGTEKKEAEAAFEECSNIIVMLALTLLARKMKMRNL